MHTYIYISIYSHVLYILCILPVGVAVTAVSVGCCVRVSCGCCGKAICAVCSETRSLSLRVRT